MKDGLSRAAPPSAGYEVLLKREDQDVDGHAVTLLDEAAVRDPEVNTILT